MTDATRECEWWDGHADRIHVWGEEGETAWIEGVDRCLVAVTEGLWDRDGVRGVRGPILDLGCGLGRLSLPLARMFPFIDVVGVDVSTEMLRQAEADRAAERLRNLLYLAGDGRKIPALPWSEKCSGAYSVLLFQHIPPSAVEQYLHEIARVLVPGGRFLCQYVGLGVNPLTSTGSFLSWAHSPGVIDQWATDAGMEVVSHQSRLIYPEWMWTTMERR